MVEINKHFAESFGIGVPCNQLKFIDDIDNVDIYLFCPQEIKAIVSLLGCEASIVREHTPGKWVILNLQCVHHFLDFFNCALLKNYY